MVVIRLHREAVFVGDALLTMRQNTSTLFLHCAPPIVFTELPYNTIITLMFP